MKLGKKPARPGAVKFKLGSYIDRSKLPPVPKHFGHETLIEPKSWGVLANDSVGDCVIAMQDHGVMLHNRIAGREVQFTDDNAIDDYSAIAGYIRGRPETDQGTDMEEAAAYWRRVGMVDAAGQRHKIAAYLDLEPGNTDDLFYATYLFAITCIGIRFPASAMDQFNAGKPWTVRRNSPIEGGHGVLVNAKRSHIGLVTWGAQTSMTAGFYRTYADEGIAVVSEEELIDNKSPEGFDAPALLADLQALGR